VTILGALTTQWKYLDVMDRRTRPHNPPSVDDCALLIPQSNANPQILNRDDPMFKARDEQGRLVCISRLTLAVVAAGHG
jgi:hypothetical protein